MVIGIWIKEDRCAGGSESNIRSRQHREGQAGQRLTTEGSHVGKSRGGGKQAIPKKPRVKYSTPLLVPLLCATLRPHPSEAVNLKSKTFYQQTWEYSRLAGNCISGGAS